ncbi:MAG: DNA translocase FtsK [Gammaproteobacteria bacterium]
MKRLIEACLLMSIMLSIFLLGALLSYNPADPGWSYSYTGYPDDLVTNLGGHIGAYISDWAYFQFGWSIFLILFFPLDMLRLVTGNFYRAYRQHGQIPNIDLQEGIETKVLVGILGWFFVLLFSTALAHWLLPAFSLPNGSGGVLGQAMVAYLSAFGVGGGYIIAVGFLAIGIWMVSGISWFLFVIYLLESVLALGRWGFSCFRKLFSRLGGIRSDGASPKSLPQEPGSSFDGALPSYPPLQPEQDSTVSAPEVKTNALSSKPLQTVKKQAPLPSSKEVASSAPVDQPLKTQPVQPPKAQLAQSSASANIKEPSSSPPVSSQQAVPSLDILDPVPQAKVRTHTLTTEAQARRLEQALADFGIRATVMEAIAGPLVTRFELEAEPGLKVSKVQAADTDLARVLSVSSIRVVELIEGKPYFGIELPNPQGSIVYLKEMMQAVHSSETSVLSRGALPIMLGADITGQPVWADIVRMPHLLVAGATGTGKSVCIHSILTSLLLSVRPEQLRLILIDPKMLELSAYESLPHLIAPVVTETAQATAALVWSIQEMERRYVLMSTHQVRDLASYNAKVSPQEQLARILIVIDELADLMMVAGKTLEQYIARIAQKARAAGIHLLLATQRPSVDVITGLIKANVPARISLRVASAIDSRTVLDQQGAQQLLERGDMLFLKPGVRQVLRVHGAFTSDEDVRNIVKAWQQLPVAPWLERLVAFPTQQAEDTVAQKEGGRSDADPDQDLYIEAVEFVQNSGKTSVSALQRHLRIGFNRAARLIEQMQHEGILGEPDKKGIRPVL